MRRTLITISLLVLGPLLGACASVAVPASRLPAAASAVESGAPDLILWLDGVPRPMAEEVLAFAGPAGRVATPDSGASLASLCGDSSSIVLRPQHDRTHFASDVPDRNLLMLYETLVIVGIPVTLLTAVIWTYYAETLVTGELALVRCSGGEEEVLRYAESFRLRSEGKGFVRTAPLEEAQFDGAIRGLTRELLARAFEEQTRK